jgi:hypothetical protein
VAKLMRKPLSELLEEVAVAVPTALDRWDVQIKPHVGPSSPKKALCCALLTFTYQ